jgi:hypothetical protein
MFKAKWEVDIEDMPKKAAIKWLNEQVEKAKAKGIDLHPVVSRNGVLCRPEDLIDGPEPMTWTPEWTDED